MTDPWQEGFEAARDGVAFHDNPYAHGGSYDDDRERLLAEDRWCDGWECWHEMYTAPGHE